MERVLIPVNEFCGHAFEYTVNLYDKAKKTKAMEFVFVVPDRFIIYSNGNFVSTDNIQVEFLKDECRVRSKKRFIKAWGKNLNLRKWIKKYKPNYVHLISYDEYYPYLPFLTIRGVRYSGIYYYIYYYDKSGILKRFYYSFLMCLMCKCKNIKRVYFCNDYRAANYTNRYFDTDKCRGLVDPVVSIKKSGYVDIRRQYGISDEEKVFFHFGVLSRRKGSLLIMQAIQKLQPSILANAYFIFVGEIQEDIKDEIYDMSHRIHSSHILIIDRFCSYDRLADFCYCADYLLMPYLDTSQSSGMLGYASRYNLPVIGPATNLLGKLIRLYKLGYTFETDSLGDFVKLLRERIIDKGRVNVSDSYSESNTPEIFGQTIFEGFRHDE